MPDLVDPRAKLKELRNKLQSNPSTPVRREAAARIGAELAAERLDGSERGIALQILEHLARDVELHVRQALAEQVRTCASLPAALALKLAEDVEQIAVPFIEVSPALLDEDLLKLVHGGGKAKQIAIAKRAAVSPAVADGLVEAGAPEAVTTLLGNPGAVLSEHACHKAIDRFPGDDDIVTLLVKRAALPLSVTDRLIGTVSKALKTLLIERHGLPWQFAHELVSLAGEGTLVDSLIAVSSVSEVERLAARLHAQGKLTASLLLRALCMGDSHFFAVAVATLARIAIEDAVQIVRDPAPQGVKSLYAKAGLSPDLFRAFRIALDAVEEVKERQRESWRKEHTERLVTRLFLAHHTACPEQLELLLDRLSVDVFGKPLRSLGGG